MLLLLWIYLACGAGIALVMWLVLRGRTDEDVTPRAVVLVSILTALIWPAFLVWSLFFDKGRRP